MTTHGLDQIQSGVRQVWTGRSTDSVTSGYLQLSGMDQNTANKVDSTISLVGSVGAGVTTAGVKITMLKMLDESTQGLSFVDIAVQHELGSKAFIDDEFYALGGHSTTPIQKYNTIKEGYEVITTYWQSVKKAYTLNMLKTGPTPGANVGLGGLGGGVGALPDSIE